MDEKFTDLSESQKNKLKNILSFLFIITHDSEVIRKIKEKNPVYILEKYNRYLGEGALDNEFEWGLHPLLKNDLEMYIERWS